MSDFVDDVISALLDLKEFYYSGIESIIKPLGISLPDEFEVLIAKLRKHSIFFRSTVLRLAIDSFTIIIVVSDGVISYHCISSVAVTVHTSVQELCFFCDFNVGTDSFIKEQVESFYSIILTTSRHGDTYTMSGGSLIKGDTVSMSTKGMSLPVESSKSMVVSSSGAFPKMENKKYTKDELKSLLASRMKSDTTLEDSSYSFREDREDIDIESTRFTKREDVLRDKPLSNELRSMFNKPVVDSVLNSDNSTFNEGTTSVNYNKDYTGRNWD